MDTSHNLSRLLKISRRRWVIYLDKRLATLGLTSSRWDALVEIANADRVLNQRELADRLGIEGATLVHLLDGLADRNLIERTPDETDRRTKRIKLTPAGKSAMSTIVSVASIVRAEILEGIPEKDRKVAVSVLQRINDRLDDLLLDIKAEPEPRPRLSAKSARKPMRTEQPIK